MPLKQVNFHAGIFASRRMLNLFVALTFLFLQNTQLVLAQPEDDNSNTEEKLAGQYYQLGQYDLAADLYEVLYDKNPATFYYSQLVNCYLNLKDTKSAEKLISRQIKRNPQQLSYLVDLAYVYQESGDDSKAKKQYEKALKELNPTDDRQVKELASSFQMRKQDEMAEKTYIQARTQFPRPYGFQLELADIYKRKHENAKMYDEYFNLLNGNGIVYLETVQNQMQDIIASDIDGKATEELRERLLKEVQRNPDNLVFSDLLVWMFLQKKDFDAAVSQSKALDKRLRENGKRVLQVARICIDNQSFEAGKRAYDYLIEKGTQSPVYAIARQELAIAMYDQLVRAPSYTQEELLNLETLLQQTLSTSTDGVSAAALAIRLGHLKAFYKNEYEQALNLLIPYTSPSNSLPPRVQNEVKLEVADIQLLMGDIWESTLTYSQIEKSMKTDTIGQEAKFRNARLAYYKGDFEWSKVQLDVLKAATSKFIANDAMELSLLIGDNMVFDTTGEALRMFSRADLWVYQNKTNDALSTLDSLNTLFPESTLADDIIYRKAKIAVKQARYSDAVDLFQKLVSLYHDDILADNAMFEMADILQFKLDKKQEAMDYYKALLTEFPGSLYVAEARRRFRQLRGDSIQ
jgi:tetratricopeptide (TPR) repeat protein